MGERDKRAPDQHLDLYALTMLASARRSGLPYARFTDGQRSAWEEHLHSCDECRELLEQQQFLLLMSDAYKTSKNSHATSGCPSEQDWMEIAAGLRSLFETQRQFEHAFHCKRCAAIFRQVAEEFADTRTEVETNFLGNLSSNNADWQATLARRMQAACSGKYPDPAPQVHRSRTVVLQLAAIIGCIVLLASAGFWFLSRRAASSVEQLLAEAYSEKRTTDLRMPGSGYAPVEVFRGSESSEIGHPESLLKAELLIKEGLAQRPDDPFWLDAQGRAELMNDNYETALTALERAHRYAPANPVIARDLASAYFLRAENLKRLEDYGRAADLLGEALSKDPQDPLARFNRAITSERLFLYQQAVDDWYRYLELDGNSPWSNEARKRLDGLQERIRLQQNRSERPLLDTGAFLVKLRDPESLRTEIEPFAERYLELALRDWLQEAFSAQTSNAATARSALNGLAKILQSKHADYWLADFLAELDREPASQTGLRSLAEYQKFGDDADYDRARKSALDATLSFRRSANLPGELMAQFKASYADQLARQDAHCLAEARIRDHPQIEQRYPWLFSQFSLESAACSNFNNENARQLAAEALTSAKQHNYPSLELRATTFLAGLYQYLGDTSSAWKYTAEGLDRYWQGDFPPVRGYSFYTLLDVVAEDCQEWFLDTQILKEASAYIRTDPDVEMRGIVAYRLANAQTMTGDLSGADESNRQTRYFFQQGQQGIRRTNLELEAEIGFAKLEITRSSADAAIRRLEPLKQRASNLTDMDLAFDYFYNLGLAYFGAGRSPEAKENLGKAISLAEQSFAQNQSERERLIWCRKADHVYRAMAQLDLDAAPQESLAQWEWFKGASLRGQRIQAKKNRSATQRFELPFTPPDDTAIISYAVLPSGIFAWTFTHSGVQLHKLNAVPSELDLLAYSFADHSSRPDSSIVTIAEEGRALYHELLEPLEPSLVHYSHLIVEPDESLWLIPFDALVDPAGAYLADHRTVSISPGLDYLALSPPWPGLSPDTDILVAGNPSVDGKQSLSDAEEEAKGIARRFRYSKLLLGGDASYSHIASGVGNAEVFHFSGHATASPDGVGLLFGDSMRMDASRVNASQFSGLQLVVFSACNSANGSRAVFDDRDSLARLLVGAGVQEVVASRWAVHSHATAMLMDEFYAQLLAGRQVSTALSEAGRRLRADRQFSHPFYWASFSAFGKS